MFLLLKDFRFFFNIIFFFYSILILILSIIIIEMCTHTRSYDNRVPIVRFYTYAYINKIKTLLTICELHIKQLHNKANSHLESKILESRNFQKMILHYFLRVTFPLRLLRRGAKNEKKWIQYFKNTTHMYNIIGESYKSLII